MNKELCFILDNKNIYLDHILVDYEYVPIFFLCKDDECQYYLALCTDIENGEYIVVKISLLNVYNLLHGNIAMRDVILNQKIFWKVVSGDEIKNDIVNEYPIDYINHQDLPEKDAKFKILQKHIKEYVQKFDKEFFASEKYDKEKSIKLNLEEIICDEELANIKCKTYFLKQTKHEIDIKEPKQKFPYSNKDDSVSSLINEEYSYRENNSNIDICETKISYAA